MKLFSEFDRVLVRKGECEGKVGRLALWVGEHVAELQDELVVAVEEGCCFRHDATPLFLMAWHDPECRFQALIVKFRLQETTTPIGYIENEIKLPLT